jgi:hypothetical protein
MSSSKENSIDIEYTEGMTMEELVEKINESNNAILLGFKSMIESQSTLLLGEIKKSNDKIDSLESKLNKLMDHFGIQG